MFKAHRKAGFAAFGILLQIEIAKFSHIGNREENQDRVEVLMGDHTVLAMVIDGMGGHSAGAEAAMTAVATISDKFRKSPQPISFTER
ncbi:MAG: protein phosphatase 2C domain-containing protein, partial [Gammaproteobacteria bacterium]|nr:protein phosphatase 2C domain-containing protein [Gammaproteobacteria bacterium]